MSNVVRMEGKEGKVDPVRDVIAESPVLRELAEKSAKTIKSGIGENGKDMINIIKNPKEKIPEVVGTAAGIAVTAATKNEVAGAITKEVMQKGTEIAVKKVGEMIDNKKAGLEREKEVKKDLEKQYPGATILSEAYLRDKDGNIVKDPQTNSARRIDFVILKNGKVIDSVEVTSKTAEKDNQIAKENRIRENGGNYVKTEDGQLVRIPNTVATRIERRD